MDCRHKQIAVITEKGGKGQKPSAETSCVSRKCRKILGRRDVGNDNSRCIL